MLLEPSNRVLEVGRVYRIKYYANGNTDTYYNLVEEDTGTNYLGTCLFINLEATTSGVFRVNKEKVKDATLVEDLGTYQELLLAHPEYFI